MGVLRSSIVIEVVLENGCPALGETQIKATYIPFLKLYISDTFFI